MFKKLLHSFLITSLLLLSVACAKLSKEHFDQIKPDMTMQQVVSILGKPTTSEDIIISGIPGTSAVWKDENIEIDIQFLNDKVTVKSFNQSDPHTPHKKTQDSSLSV